MFLKQFTNVLNELNDDEESKTIMREGIEGLATTIAGLKARIDEESTDETEREITDADIENLQDPLTTEVEPISLKQQLTTSTSLEEQLEIKDNIKSLKSQIKQIKYDNKKN